MNRSGALLRLCVLAISSLVLLAGCSWKGVNSLPLPGTAASEDGAYMINIEMPDVSAITENSRVRVNDVDVGYVKDIRLQNWHALVTVKLAHDVLLPIGVHAKIGQTSLLGALHIELNAPVGSEGEPTMTGGATIPLDHAGAFPTTEQTLASVSTLLNGGGIGQIHDITTELNGALSGHEPQVRNLLKQLDEFTAALNGQRHDIIAAADGLDRLSGKVNQQESSLQRALDTIPQALRVLDAQQEQLTGAITSVGGFADVANQVVQESFSGVVQNLRSLHPALKGLADSGRSLTRGLPGLLTPPFAMENVTKFMRGDYANLSATIDLTLGRIDNSMLIGTPQDGTLAAVERAMGRTEGNAPSPRTTNPLTAPLTTVIQRGN